MPEEPDLSAEDLKILDEVWDEIQKEARLEELGEGPPRWDLDRARQERPQLSDDRLAEWLRVANEEYRRLRIQRVARSASERRSIEAANERVSCTWE
jgi:hypothetical protein